MYTKIPARVGMRLGEFELALLFENKKNPTVCIIKVSVIFLR